MAEAVLANRRGEQENVNPNILRDVNVTVDGTGLDTMIPVIPKANKTDIKAGFKFAVLAEIKGRPTFEKMKVATRELARNALTVKVSFGGGKKGVLALVIGDAAFLKEAKQAWALPASQGAFPTIVANATPTAKKKAISKFIQNETDLNIVEEAHELLKGQFIGAIEECYIKEMCEGYSEYDNHSLLDLLKHVNTKYATLDDHVLEEIQKKFEEPPDLSIPIDVYYAKQEECQKLAEDTDHKIRDEDMVKMLQKHMGATGTLTKKQVKFGRRDKARKTWALGKEFYREEIEDLEEAAKCAGTDEFLANSTVVDNNNASTENNVRNKMVDRFGESFDALAMAAEASKSTYEDQARTITTLTSTNAELTGQVKKLTSNVVTLSERLAALTKQRYDNAPPGFGNDKADTGSAANSAGVFMPTIKKKGKEFFASKQQCGQCGKAAFHLPAFCPENPKRKALREAEAALAKAKEAAKA